MGCLKSIEAPLCVIISVVFLVRGLFAVTFKLIQANGSSSEDLIDFKDTLMAALAIMSLVGTCSSRRAFGAFTLVFMLNAFLFSLFHVFHVISTYVQSIDAPCRFHATLTSEMQKSSTCHALNVFNIVTSVLCMIATALATMAVFVRLTTITLEITDLRGLATSRSFDNSVPRLIRERSIESEREEEERFEKKPERKLGVADLFV